MRKLLLLLFVFYATNLAAATYYVAVTGSDSNNGSQSAPWATINHAARTIAPGDTVIVENGTYVQTVIVNRSGSSGAPFTFQAQNKWGAIIAPTSAQVASQSGIIVDFNGGYIVWKKFEVIGPSDGSAEVGIKAQSSGSNDVLFGNKVHEIGLTQCNGGSGIESAASYTVIDSNEVYDVGEPSSAKCNLWSHIYVNAGTSQTVINNLLIGRGSGYNESGVQFNNSTKYNFGSNMMCSSNTIVNIGGTGLWLACASGTCSNNVVSNNIFYADSTGGGNVVLKWHSYGGVWDSSNVYPNNLIFASGASFNCNNSAACGAQQFTDTVTANPEFVNYTGDQTGDYHLRSGSPAIDAGASDGAPNHDFDGNSRPQGCCYDIGSYEYVFTLPDSPASDAELIN